MTDVPYITKELIEMGRAAASSAPLTQNLSDEAMTAIIKVLYKHIYADLHSDKEMDEYEALMLREVGWSANFEFWMEGATPDEAEALIDAALEAMDSSKPEHVNISGVGSLNPGVHHRPE